MEAIFEEVINDIKNDIPSFELYALAKEKVKRLDLLEKVVLRARTCLDGLRQNLTTENQKIIGAFYSIIAPLRTKDTAKKCTGQSEKRLNYLDSNKHTKKQSTKQ